MNRLVFETQSVVLSSDPNRTDVACFIGFVGRRNTPLPANVRRWLEQGWAGADLDALLNIPVLIDRWDLFDQLFAWDQRNYNNQGLQGATYLGAAVRSFFAQGGSRCYVVRVGDPWTAKTERVDRLAQIKKLIPGYPERLEVAAIDRRSWAGIGHLFGLPDVSFVCLPDLPDAVQVQMPPVEEPEIAALEQFVECSELAAPPLKNRVALSLQVPQCDAAGYADWARAVHLVAELLVQSHRSTPSLREVQLVVAVPLPIPGVAVERNLLASMTGANPPLANHPRDHQDGIASAFVQLVYPWVQTPGSLNLPQQLESPDGVLVGILARTAITLGSFRSAASSHLADVQILSPVLTRDQLYQPYLDQPTATAAHHSLIERVSLLGATPAGLRLLSDVTTSLNEEYRLASVNRLVALILRTARRLGEEYAFSASGATLWSQMKTSLDRVLLGLFQAGALWGKTAAEAFQVRCDRTTMTQSDLDNGRTIATVQFTAAMPIEQITLTLAMNEGGQLSLSRDH
ncbi:hypothetical protein AB3R30_07305 [Leptolyngbyaceae cyanobacterium UHCC 1019]